ncbi:hypothetical protein GUJ93_ZPchr0012g20447 [Zizania palustris]|uniref:Uncharacterized protein n=1 Tax=Zizania palustris TaxID=103762 RepID=A0A8J6BS76_ZIZPA|nr:hypothetical protein GUJ93_ZPchr0012g20447 [Zizania palustris]
MWRHGPSLQAPSSQAWDYAAFGPVVWCCRLSGLLLAYTFAVEKLTYGAKSEWAPSVSGEKRFSRGSLCAPRLNPYPPCACGAHPSCEWRRRRREQVETSSSCALAAAEAEAAAGRWISYAPANPRCGTGGARASPRVLRIYILVSVEKFGDRASERFCFRGLLLLLILLLNFFTVLGSGGNLIAAAAAVVVFITTRNARRTDNVRRALLAKLFVFGLPGFAACLSFIEIIMLIKNKIEGKDVAHYESFFRCSQFLAWMVVGLVSVYGCWFALYNPIICFCWILKILLEIPHLQYKLTLLKSVAYFKEVVSFSMAIVFGLFVIVPTVVGRSCNRRFVINLTYPVFMSWPPVPVTVQKLYWKADISCVQKLSCVQKS